MRAGRIQLRLLTITFSLNDTTTTEVYTLSLHDALPICARLGLAPLLDGGGGQLGRDLVDVLLEHAAVRRGEQPVLGDRKSTRLNSSHVEISYAVFCLKKKRVQNSTSTKSAA